MADTKADTATTKKAETKAAAKPAPKATATKSAQESESLPGASAPAVAAEAQAKKSETTLTSTEAQDLVSKDGDFGPFRDNAPPTGAALDATTDEVDTSVDFRDNVPFTATEGDVYVAVREHNQRNIVEIAPAGWTGPGQVFAPYQVKSLIKALQEVQKGIKK